MSLLRLVSLLILAVWVGGAVVLGSVAAPAIFSVLEAHDPAGGRTLAGVVFGHVLARFQQLSWILGGLFVAVMGVRAALGPRPRRLSLRLWLAAAMIAASVTTALYVSPRIEAIRDATSGAVAALPDGDPRKVQFGRLHGLSNVLMILTIAAGVGLMYAEMKDH
jgi:hypothetical protein